jgi:ABC-type multidrug transport system fused ATPase/permease subunit
VAVYVAGYYMVPLVLLYILLGINFQRYCMKLFRELTRLKGTTSSPIIQTFSEALLGCKVIRVFEAEPIMEQRFMQTLDECQKNTILNCAGRQYFAERIQFMALLVILPAIAMAVRRFYSRSS